MGKNFGLVHDDQVVIMIHCGSQGVRAPDRVRLPQDLRRSDEALRHRGEGQGTRLRPVLLEGGPGLLRRHGLRRQHGLRQPPGHRPQGEGGVPEGLPPGPGGAGHAHHLRRVPQHRQGGEACPGRGDPGAGRTPQGRDPGASARATRTSPLHTGRSGSPSS